MILCLIVTISKLLLGCESEKWKHGIVSFHSLAARNPHWVFSYFGGGEGSLAPTFLSLVGSAKFFLVLIINVTCLCSSYPANH